MSFQLFDHKVSVLQENIFEYPLPPFNPSELYPETNHLPYKVLTQRQNEVYRMVRSLMHLHHLDDDRYDTADWNPLSELISKGNSIVIKPNMVSHIHPLGKTAVLSSITHASVIRPVIDYVILALQGEGQITICDAPVQSGNFDKACQANGLSDLVKFYQAQDLRNIKISLLDLRKEFVIPGPKIKTVKLPGDPSGYTIIDLQKNSFHSEIDQNWQKYAITNYDLLTLRKYHNDKSHCYFIPNTILNADVIISLPKMKTHRKAGISLSLKNFVGTNASKDFLPHHREGNPSCGGDEYPCTVQPQSLMANPLNFIIKKFPLTYLMVPIWKRYFKREKEGTYRISEGNWQGNDTLWRTILDINTIVRYADKKGKLAETPQRKFLFLVDSIIGQEREGPMEGKPKNCGLLILGSNPSAVDYVAAKIMGLNYQLINQINYPYNHTEKSHYPLANFSIKDIEVNSNKKDYINIQGLCRQDSLKFIASGGWKNLESD